MNTAETERERLRAYRERDPERWREYARDYRQANKETLAAKARERRKTPKERARKALRKAVEVGKIIKPEWCEECAEPAILHGHHKDYSKPLVVEWLCAICHAKRHRLPPAQEVER